MTPRRVLLSWSSGKDSAWALHELRQRSEVAVYGLLTTVNATHERVAMHAVRRTLLQQQAEAVGLPLIEVPLPHPCTNAQYEAAMDAALAQARRDGVDAVAFGDLLLEDVRRYRESQLARHGLEPLFPLWGRDTRALAHTMLAHGARAWITCVDPRQVPADWAGRAWDAALLEQLPAGVDPCGESGEFHTFCWDGPAFRHPVPVTPGEVVAREGFVFADLLRSPSVDDRGDGEGGR